MGRKRSTRLDLPPGVHFIKGRYYLISTKGKRESTPLGSDLLEAKRKWAELTALQNSARSNTISGLIDRYILEVLNRKDKNGKFELSEKTRKGYMNQTEMLRAVFGRMLPTELKPMHVAQFLRKHPSKISANRHIALLSTIFTNALEWGIVDKNPCTGVKRNKERPRDRLPTEEEKNAIDKHAPELLRLMIRLVELTGMREQNVRLVMLQHITDDGLLVVSPKTGKKQLFLWTPELRAVIDEALVLRRGSLSMYLFLNRNGRPYTESGIQTLWQRVCKRAGVQDLHFHDLRADTATEAEEQGLDAQKLLAHSDGRTTRIYLRNKRPVRVTPITRAKKSEEL